MDGTLIGHARGTLTEGRRVELTTGHHQLTSDEPASLGGHDAHPGPFDLVMSGLAACTAATLRMYAERKGWEIGPIHVEASLVRDSAGAEHIERHIVIHGVDEVQRHALGEIAEKTPVTLTLRRGAAITTSTRSEG